MEMQFLDSYQMDPERQIYKFIAVSNNRRFVCVVSVEALEDNFQVANEPSVETVFIANKPTLEDLAEAKIRANVIEQNGEVLILNKELRSRIRGFTK